MINKQESGQRAESAARHYLELHGLQWIASNVRDGKGLHELDLIMQDQDCLVFVEVRSRKNVDYGHPLDSITPHKQRNIIRAATAYLLKKQMYDKVACRFDVMSITGNEGSCTWIKDAFRIDF